MKKEKLNLNDLEFDSFITTLECENKKIFKLVHQAGGIA